MACRLGVATGFFPLFGDLLVVVSVFWDGSFSLAVSWCACRWFGHRHRSLWQSGRLNEARALVVIY